VRRTPDDLLFYFLIGHPGCGYVDWAETLSQNDTREDSPCSNAVSRWFECYSKLPFDEACEFHTYLCHYAYQSETHRGMVLDALDFYDIPLTIHPNPTP